MKKEERRRIFPVRTIKQFKIMKIHGVETNSKLKAKKEKAMTRN